MNISEKASYLLLILSIILPLFLFNGAIDPFAPVHTVPMNEIIHAGHVTDILNYNTPSFYVFGSIISLITGILPENTIYLPIQLIPAVLIFFAFSRKISDSNIIGSLLTIIYSISDITGNKFFFWMHGLGLIILFQILFISIKKLEKINSPRNGFLILISVFSLVFISYDITFQVLLLLISIIFILLINRESRKNTISFFNMFLVLIIVQLGLSNFVFETLTSQLRFNENYFSSIEAFIFNFHYSTNSNYILKDFAIVYPQSIGITSAIKYIILAVSILIAIMLTYNRYKKIKNFEYFSIAFYSFLFMAIGYILAKLSFGQLPIGILLFPGLISIGLINRFINNKKMFSAILLFALFALLIFSSVNYYLYYSNDLINKDENHYKYIESSADWYSKYSKGPAASDIQTNNLYYMHISKAIIQKGDTLNPIYDYFTTLDPTVNIFPITQNNSISNPNIKYYVINRRLNTVSIEKWIILKPWRYLENSIDKNQDLTKIYNSKDITIYQRI